MRFDRTTVVIVFGIKSRTTSLSQETNFCIYSWEQSVSIRKENKLKELQKYKGAYDENAASHRIYLTYTACQSKKNYLFCQDLLPVIIFTT